MAARKTVILAVSGILLFGALTFCIGMLVGLNLDREDLPAASPPPAQEVPKDAEAKPDVAAAKDEAEKQAAPPVTVMDVPDPPHIIPVDPSPPVVTDVSSAADPSQPVASPLMGPLAAQAATPVLPPPQPAVPAPPPSNRVLAVQLGRFTRLDSATVFSKRLTERGYRPQIVMADYQGMPPWYLVTLGPQPDEATAKRVAADMSRVLEVEVIVISWAGKPAG